MSAADAGKMLEGDWRCAGCGIVSPKRVRKCDCPTEVVIRDGTGENDWKIPTEEFLEGELGLLYNHAPDDSRQFTRWGMHAAIHHGMRIADERAKSEITRLQTKLTTPPSDLSALRAEIEALRMSDGGLDLYRGYNNAVDDILAIIDRAAEGK